MSIPQAIVLIEAHVDGIYAADLAARVAVPAAKPREEAHALAKLFGALGSQQNAELRVRVDSAAGVAAAKTILVTGANIANAEWIALALPNGQTFKVTGQAGAAVSGDGFFTTSGTDDTAATNIRAAFNTLPGFSRFCIVSGATNALIFTMVEPGTHGNGARVVDGTVNGLSSSGLLASGLDPTTQVEAYVTCVQANLDADDTFTFGVTVLTAKASGASGEDEFNIGADDTELGDNFIACLTAHSEIAGLCTAVNDAGSVTITFTCDPRVARQIVLATSDTDGFDITQPSIGTTLASVQIARTYALGAA